MPKKDKDGLLKAHDESTSTFLKIMTEFHDTAKVELDEVAAKIALMDDRFKALAKYFGEDEASFQPRDFFGHVTAFVQQFEKALDEIRQLKSENKSSGGAAGSAEDKEDYMKLFQQLKDSK
ncbi:hypothetical protein T484DRAFT_3053050 [Baffinella frigidus]|nr:hypothetical protein T484DRAFT_3053050 [Cryptophyta sp. CCMP2293]